VKAVLRESLRSPQWGRALGVGRPGPREYTADPCTAAIPAFNRRGGTRHRDR
jgi:hypothetical protein